MWTLAIDFGTSNTAAALWADGKTESLEVDGERRVPSVVLMAADGTLVVGREAANQAALHPDRVHRAVKRRVGRSTELLFDDASLPITTVIAALLRPFADEGRRQRNGEEPAAVVLTHPARWGPERLEVLAAAAAEAGLANVSFLPEPVAAAIHYADEHLVEGHVVAVYDLGGGTFDTAVLERHGESFSVRGMPGGDEFIGGEYFDDTLFKHFGELIARQDAELWGNIESSDDRQWRDANAALREQCRRAKETLSSNPTAYVRVVDRDLHITRDEFERLIEQDIERTVAELDRTLQMAGVTKEHIGRLYLAGGAGRIPLVHRELTVVYADRLVTWADPKFVVALGAALHASRELPVEQPPAPAPSAPLPTAPGSATPPAPVYPAAPALLAPAAYAAPAPMPMPSPVPSPTSAPVPQPAYPQPGVAPPGYTPAGATPSGSPPGRDKTTISYVCAGVGLLCCISAFVGLYFANEAKKAGDPQAQTALIANIVALLIGGGISALILLSSMSTTTY